MAESNPQISINFFAQAGNEGLGTVYVDGQHLTADSDHTRKALIATYGKYRLDILDYDSFVIFGAKSRTFWPSDTFYSSACLDAAIEDLTIHTPAHHVLSCLREVTDAPICIGHTPLVAARNIRERAVSETYLAGIKILNNRIFNKLDAKMIGQPLSTIVNGFNTAPEYSWGVPKLSAVNSIDHAQGESTDNTHMDAAFGKLWLEEFFENNLSKSKRSAQAEGCAAHIA
jgi:hypothetical protein